MQVGRPLVAVSLLTAQSTMAADALTGTFRGDGRACYGALFLRSNTIEWNASFFKCGPTRYKVIEQDLSGDHPHAAFKIEDHRKRCGLAVIEVSRYSEFSWSVKGYQTMEAYQKREEPDWKDSADPARQVAVCGMRKE
ncbi:MULTISPECIES: hypothetical protein [Ralstonia]|jgi:hypothetical protein|uniref:Uncharacterized protein n=1 Tax=Ralstonia pickettii OR214 TaxID=1264675 RepID=R0CRB6_RALPI|nr:MULTISPECIES: hypothetical protein [Ralstonia]MEA3268685.1 hypothetical protein [Pseudomonadota bacterium]ENZ78970.1 hypothetical protein OR214_01490 [Ralstonia pickettii OR214]MBL4776998.1 hypothetical protein [Ralstonia sp.]MCM3581168.1 hypothetical protein [Ralstonia pickettii]MDR9385779.1 hypothetical protein [Ralstonia sp. 11b]